jgi:uncharacterized protein
VSPQHNGDSHTSELADWRAQARIFLQPIAAPSILGLFGFAAATFIVAAHAAGWYGDDASPDLLFPFAATFGGVAQFAAGMWAYRARDGLATAMHGMWGSFWIAYGILWLLIAIGVITLPASGAISELGFWFCTLAVITALGALAAAFENLGLTVVLGSLATGAGLFAVFYLTGISGFEIAAGWTLIGSAIAATYVAGALMFEGTAGRVILPLGKYGRAANVPGSRVTHAIEYERAEPGVRHGQ